MAYGVSFQPSKENDRGASGTPKIGTQNAIQMLNLRLPRITGGAVTPQALLESPGAAGLGMGGMSPEKNAILQWLKKLLADNTGQDVATTRGDGGGDAERAAIQPGLGGAPGAQPLISREMLPSITLGNGPVGDSGPGFGTPRGGSDALLNAPPPEGGGDFPPLAPGSYQPYSDPFDVPDY